MDVQALMQNLCQEVSCSLCKNNFTDPKQLPCLHSFCLHCLNELQRASEYSDKIICPECLKQFKAPASGDLKDLPTNVRISSLLEVLAIKERNATGVKCGNCDKRSVHSSYCFHCGAFQCKECISLHNEDKANGEHHVLALKDFQDQDLEKILERAGRQYSPNLCFGEAGMSAGLTESASAGLLQYPWGVAVNERDEVAVTDSQNDRVQVFSNYGSHLATFGAKKGYQHDLNVTFRFPTGIVFDKNGNIVVADTSNYRIVIISRRGEYLRKFGEEGSLDHQLNRPYGLSLDSDGNIIVADTGNKLIKFFSPSGEFLRKLGGEGILANAPHCIQQGQNFIVSDLGEHCIKIFDLKGNYLYKFGREGKGDGEFNSPRCLLVNQAGHLVVLRFTESPRSGV